MSESDQPAVHAQDRERVDPEERIRPMPILPAVIAVGMVLFGIIYIINSGPYTNPALGDHRTLADLRPQAAGGGVAQEAVQHHAHRLARCAQVAHRQVGVIGKRGGRPHHHRIVAHPQGMDRPAGERAGDPAAFAVGGGDAAIQRGGKLHGDEGQAAGDTLQEALVQRGGLSAADPFGHLDARGAQNGMATASDAGVGIGQGGDDT